MKLELKHLASYLPYKLIWIDCDYEHTHEMIGLEFDRVMFISDQNDYGFCNISEINTKPILRPLSDLTKEIEINGEKFIPSKLINEAFGCQFTETIILTTNINNLQYSIIQKLLEWYFDIFNLNCNNLCIYYSELNK